MNKLIGIALLSLFSSPLYATEITSAKITQLMLDRNYTDKVFIQLDKKNTAGDTCHDNTRWEYVLDISDNLGKTIYSSLLASFAAGKTVNLKGTNNCLLYTGVETLSRVEIL
ncbi:hypothetical protein [uncultured Shewanella sp.]|uniref:hypothetical protein n=1 Tax=uncultured Shewanella sp. TaxID=173975 RepID=UPI0026121A54|nr:hypothetical protein [uncultured Shewanella sp.]